MIIGRREMREPTIYTDVNDTVSHCAVKPNWERRRWRRGLKMNVIDFIYYSKI
jgi:hypothetical protein